MAKKPRTPPPPKRPVQAPQRRDRRRGVGTHRNLWPWIAALTVVAAAAVGVALYFALRDNGHAGASTTSATTSAGSATNSRNSLPGIRKIKAPWPPEYAHLADRLRPLKLQALSQEALAYHIHQQLNIFVNGKRIEVPASIGINDSAYLTELHTHDTTGIIHIEAESSNLHYTLGDFFAEWGIFLSKTCVGAYCHGYTWYVDGKQQTGNAWDLGLGAHQVITIAIGKPPKKIPSTYQWQGL